jgi:4'-phosphopantetheinyl transferase
LQDRELLQRKDLILASISSLEETIDIWQMPLEPKSNLPQIWLYLSADEQERANRFKFDLHRDRFIMARGNLRMILGEYLNVSPTDINFSYTSRGKPTISNYSSLQFNLSHSHELAVYAITANTAIGIDLEYQRPVDDLLQLAERFFNDQEYQMLKTFTPSDQQQIFLQIWTLKEAYLKATGEGLVKLAEAQTRWKQKSLTGLVFPLDKSHWTSYQFQPNPNYIAAVVGVNKKLSFVNS